jgi:NCAIR mutase (PurE)-related protein
MIIGLSRVVVGHARPRTFARCFSGESISLANILRSVQDGNMTLDDAEKTIQAGIDCNASPEDTIKAFANLDHSRTGRTGFPEAVFAEGKTPDQVARILDDMARSLNEQIIRGGVQEAQRAIIATRYVDGVRVSSERMHFEQN